jgi:uncharacterized protein (TIGR02001 family)
MKRRAAKIATCCVGLPALAFAVAPDAAAQAAGSKISGYVTVTSDYRNRGLSQSLGEPSLQFGGDFQHATGFFAGGRAATVEYAAAAPRGSSRHGEATLYAGYSRRVGTWSLVGSLGRYTYPGSDFDYDYSELSGSVGFRNRVFVAASYTGDFLNRGVAALNHELGIALPLGAGFEIGAGLGRFRSSGLDVDYTHWNFGASKLVARFGIDVRYYDNSHSVRYYENMPGARVPLGAPVPGEWVLSVSYGFNPGR